MCGRSTCATGAVDMMHGSGGRAMAQLIDELFASRLGNPLSRAGQRRRRAAGRRAGW
jgi:hypothetical protein